MANFISKYKNHSICMKASWFENVKGQVIKHAAEIINFDSQGKFNTEDKKKIAFLKNHAEFGINIFEEKEESPVE